MNPLLRMLEQVPMVPSSNCEPQRSLLVFEILDTLHSYATPVNNLCCVTYLTYTIFKAQTTYCIVASARDRTQLILLTHVYHLQFMV